MVHGLKISNAGIPPFGCVSELGFQLLLNRGEALRIHREEVLPVCDQIGDAKGRAVTMGQIADILQRSADGQTALIAYAGEPFVVAPLRLK